jgi:hypothetical protein
MVAMNQTELKAIIDLEELSRLRTIEAAARKVMEWPLTEINDGEWNQADVVKFKADVKVLQKALDVVR